MCHSIAVGAAGGRCDRDGELQSGWSVSSRAAVPLLGLLHRSIGIGRPGLPVSGEGVVPGAAQGIEDDRIVVDDDADGAAVAELLEQLELDDGGRSMIALWAHDDAPAAEPVVIEPAHRVVVQVMRATSEEHDLVIPAEHLDDGDALGVHCIISGGGEEGGPILGAPFEMAQPMADIGDDPVEIDDRQGTFAVGLTHAALSSRADSAAW